MDVILFVLQAEELRTGWLAGWLAGGIGATAAGASAASQL